jgi:heme-degrading monooxygenase HmoA
MFTQATRYSATEQAMEKGEKIYKEKAKPMWSKQQGFHSMNMYKVAEGPNKDKGHRLVVLRFNDQASMDAAREKLGEQREAMLKELDQAGIKTEEVMKLEEIA